MITIRQILTMFEVLEAYGLRAPETYLNPASDGSTGRMFAARAYMVAFNHGGYLWPEIERAALEYALEPQEGQYPKPWPTPGHIAARTAVARLAATMGTPADADRAWVDFCARATTLISRGRPPTMEYGRDALDPDPHRHKAMWAGLVSLGGWDTYRMSDPSDRGLSMRFRAAYVAHREQQRISPAVVREILTAPPLLLTVKP